jgi:hypothetical protein
MIGALALVLGVEAYDAAHPLDFSDPVSLNWRLSAEAARRDAPGASVLCIGDSLVKHGVIPKVFEARTGRKACNLGIARGPAPATYVLLRRALEAGARPSAIVVDFKPSVLIGSPRYNLRYWQEIATPRECLEMLGRDGSGSLLTALVIGRLLPSYRARLEIRGSIVAALRGEPNPMRLINRMCKRNWTVNDGANVAAKNPAFTGQVTAEQHQTLFSHVSYCHRVNRAFVRRLCALTAERGIPVYWLLPPLSPELQARREQTGAEKGYVEFVRSFQEKYPHVVVVDGRHAHYRHDVFVDATHLDGQGAEALTIALAEVVMRGPPRGEPSARWVNLADYRKPPALWQLEDAEQSRKIVRADGDRARR